MHGDDGVNRCGDSHAGDDGNRDDDRNDDGDDDMDDDRDDDVDDDGMNRGGGGSGDKVWRRLSRLLSETWWLLCVQFTIQKHRSLQIHHHFVCIYIIWLILLLAS